MCFAGILCPAGVIVGIGCKLIITVSTLAQNNGGLRSRDIDTGQGGGADEDRVEDVSGLFCSDERAAVDFNGCLSEQWRAGWGE